SRAHMLGLLVALGGGAAAVCAWPAGARAGGDRVLPCEGVPPPPGMEGVAIVEKLGATVPLDLGFTDETGAPIQLGSLLGDGKPVILTFNYSACPMLCSVQRGGLVASLNELTWSAGVQFRIITIGLNPMEDH